MIKTILIIIIQIIILFKNNNIFYFEKCCFKCCKTFKMQTNTNNLKITHIWFCSYYYKYYYVYVVETY